MSIPDLDHRGLLPSGTHVGSLDEIEARFCGNPHRQALWARAREFIDMSLAPILNGCPLILAGSFFSDKQNPGDIEATVIIELIDANSLPLIRLGGAHDTIHQGYGVDFYCTIRVPGYNDFSVFFQYVGPKSATAKNLHPRELRGVVRVM